MCLTCVFIIFSYYFAHMLYFGKVVGLDLLKLISRNDYSFSDGTYIVGFAKDVFLPFLKIYTHPWFRDSGVCVMIREGAISIKLIEVG